MSDTIDAVRAQLAAVTQQRNELLLLTAAQERYISTCEIFAMADIAAKETIPLCFARERDAVVQRESARDALERAKADMELAQRRCRGLLCDVDDREEDICR